jgi:hypothetical protein
VPRPEAHRSEGPVHLDRGRCRALRLLRLRDRDGLSLRRLVHRAVVGAVPHRRGPLPRWSGRAGLDSRDRVRPCRATRKRACSSTADDRGSCRHGSGAYVERSTRR